MSSATVSFGRSTAKVSFDVDQVSISGGVRAAQVIDPVVVPTGPPGSTTAAAGYTHNQVSPLAVWTVAHNLGRRPNVSVSSVGGVGVVQPEINYLSDNVLTITFDVPFSGRAYAI